MYCTRCGTYNNDDLSNCVSCGEVMIRPRTTEPARPYTAPPSQQPYPGYQSGYSPNEPYQPYQSSYADQLPSQSQNASNRSITAMILSLVGIALCGPLTSIPGAILGRMEMSAIRDGKAPQAGLIFAKIGFYLGLVISVLWCLGTTAWVVIAVLAAIADR